MSQQEAADAIGIRQATLSHIEQGLSLPNCALLRELCVFFDVTPTFLLDDERGVVPRPTERWHLRNVLVTVGMWAEAPADAVEDSGRGKLLFPLLPGERFYDAEAVEQRRRFRQPGKVREVLRVFDARRHRNERALVEELEADLKLHPQRRRKR